MLCAVLARWIRRRMKQRVRPSRRRDLALALIASSFNARFAAFVAIVHSTSFFVQNIQRIPFTGWQESCLINYPDLTVARMYSLLVHSISCAVSLLRWDTRWRKCTQQSTACHSARKPVPMWFFDSSCRKNDVCETLDGGRRQGKGAKVPNGSHAKLLPLLWNFELRTTIIKREPSICQQVQTAERWRRSIQLT